MNVLFLKRKKRKPEWLLQLPVIQVYEWLFIDTVYWHCLLNSHKKIEAAFTVKKQYVLGLLPSKGYSAYQDTHTEGKKDRNPPMA